MSIEQRRTNLAAIVIAIKIWNDKTDTGASFIGVRDKIQGSLGVSGDKAQEYLETLIGTGKITQKNGGLWVME